MGVAPIREYIVENSGRQIKIDLDLIMGYLAKRRMTEVPQALLRVQRFITIEAS